MPAENKKKKDKKPDVKTEKKVSKEKVKQEKEYEQKIKEVVNGFLITSEKEPEKKQPIVTADPVKTKPAVEDNQNYKEIRQAVLEELKKADRQEAVLEKVEAKKPQFSEVKKVKDKKMTSDFKIEKKTALSDNVKKSKKKEQEKIKTKSNQPVTAVSSESTVDKSLVQKNKKVRNFFGKTFKVKVKKEKNKHPKKFSFGRLVKIVIVLIILLLIIWSAGIMLGGWQGPVSAFLTKNLPYPALYINGDFVKVSDFYDDLNALSKYLSRSGQAIDQTGLKKQVMESLIEKEVIRNMAEQKNISLTDEEVSEFIQSIQTQAGEDELNRLVTDLYGWSFENYTDKVLKPLLLTQKVEADFYDSEEVMALKNEMDGYEIVLQDDPEKFTEIAGAVNEDSTKVVSGDLGWFKLGEMVPEFELVLLNLDEGEISEVITSRFGFHIILLHERIIDESGQTAFHASHIFKKLPSFAEYLDRQIEQAEVVTLIKI